MFFITAFILGVTALGGNNADSKARWIIAWHAKGWLSDLPFINYVMPGFILILLKGLLPLFTFTGLLFKWTGSCQRRLIPSVIKYFEINRG